jgi:hypothetical protein
MNHFGRRSFLKLAGTTAAIWAFPVHKILSGVEKRLDYTSPVPKYTFAET